MCFSAPFVGQHFPLSLNISPSFDITLCVRQAPEFPEFSSHVLEAINALGGSVFPKLNWSAPRVNTTPFHPARCYSKKWVVRSLLCCFVCLQGCQLDCAEQFPAVSQPQRHFPALQELRLHHPRPHAAVSFARFCCSTGQERQHGPVGDEGSPRLTTGQTFLPFP